MTRIGRFDEDALAVIADAVRRAEHDVSAEIVTCIVGRCDDYAEADWAAAVLGGGVGLLVWLAVTELMNPWTMGSPLILAFAVMLGALAGWGLAAIPSLRRLLVPNRVLDGRTRLRAQAAFTEEEVFATRNRTGILMFLGLFEHRCVVLADSGVLTKLAGKEGDAEGAVATLREPVRIVCEGMREGRPVDGVLAGIEACRRLLAEAGMKRPAADIDEDAPAAAERGELGDIPRMRDE